ncbi:MAG: class I SAM-dependent methyltransferase [Candidatus Dormibacteria bacterium]
MSESGRQQGLVFGEVASLYESSRPGYPDQIFDEVEQFASLRSGSKILEIGAGTGKATLPMAHRGWNLLALEPNGEMASVARANLESCPAVRLVEASFENWDPPETGFAAVCAAQSWHWVDPCVAFAKAAWVMAWEGTLALIWYRAIGGDERIRKELDQVYRRLVPGISATPPSELEGDRSVAINASGLFGPVTRVEVPWQQEYSGRAYTDLMRTQSDHRLLAPPVLDDLLLEAEQTIERWGGRFRVDYMTLLYLARRRSRGPGHG